MNLVTNLEGHLDTLAAILLSIYPIHLVSYEDQVPAGILA